MKLFDYIKVLFGKDVNWDKVSNYDKSKNSFMTNRFMSIKFPIQANMFNTLKIDNKLLNQGLKQHFHSMQSMHTRSVLYLMPTTGSRRCNGAGFFMGSYCRE